MSGSIYEAASTELARRLSPEAFAHSEAVARTAAALAAEYGVDTEQARIAGLLHDWSRDEGDPSLLNGARDSGTEVGPVDASVPYLLHAAEGARGVRLRFPEIEPVVLDAIERHTFGSPDMTPLDMIVYVADMIEPKRSFDGVEDLRASIGTDALAGLYERAYAASLLHLVQARKHLHPRTVESWNAIVDRGRVDEGAR